MTSYTEPPEQSRVAGGGVATLVVSFGLVIITLALRLWARFQIIKSPGWDDLTAVLATCCSLIGLVLNTLFHRWGGDRHVQYLDELRRLNTPGFLNVAMTPFLFCIAMTKISIACMVIRLTSERWMKRCMYALIASLVIVNGTCIILLFANCPGTHAVWVFFVHSKCRPAIVLRITSHVQAVWTVVTDLICTFTPLVMVWKLQMDLPKKISITVLIGFGLATTACSIGRIVEYSKVTFEDFSWPGVSIGIWTTLEENIGLIAANLPPLGAFSRVLYGKIAASRSARSASARLSTSRVPTIGASRPRRSKDSDFELIVREGNQSDFS